MINSRLVLRCRRLQRGLATELRGLGYSVTIQRGNMAYLPWLDVSKPGSVGKMTVVVRVRPVGHVAWVFEARDAEARDCLMLYGRDVGNAARVAEKMTALRFVDQM